MSDNQILKIFSGSWVVRKMYVKMAKTVYAKKEYTFWTLQDMSIKIGYNNFKASKNVISKFQNRISQHIWEISHQRASWPDGITVMTIEAERARSRELLTTIIWEIKTTRYLGSYFYSRYSLRNKKRFFLTLYSISVKSQSWGFLTGYFSVSSQDKILEF